MKIKPLTNTSILWNCTRVSAEILNILTFKFLSHKSKDTNDKLLDAKVHDSGFSLRGGKRSLKKIKVSQKFSQISPVLQSLFLSGTECLKVLNVLPFWGLSLAFQRPQKVLISMHAFALSPEQ